MGIRQAIGEVGKRNVINIGERIKVTYLENEQRVEKEGVLIEVSGAILKLNGDTPSREINVKNILKIEKH